MPHLSHHYDSHCESYYDSYYERDTPIFLSTASTSSSTFCNIEKGYANCLYTYLYIYIYCNDLYLNSGFKFPFCCLLKHNNKNNNNNNNKKKPPNKQTQDIDYGSLKCGGTSAATGGGKAKSKSRRDLPTSDKAACSAQAVYHQLVALYSEAMHNARLLKSHEVSWEAVLPIVWNYLP